MLSKFRRVVAWLVQVLIAAAFVAVGLGKFSDPSWERSFARWGYPPGAHYVVGVLELLGGLIVLVPRFTSYGAFFLAVIMIGAMATHALAGQPWTRPLPHFCVLLLLAALRWPERRRPLVQARSGDAAAS